MENINWKEIEAAEEKDYERITPGGYVCRIIEAIDNDAEKYVELVMDIVEGEHKDFGARTEERTGYDFGYLKKRQYYKGKSVYFFKKFLETLQESNRRFIADNFKSNPDALVNLLVGCTVGDYEYVGKNKEGKMVKKIRANVDKLVSVDAIRSGDFETPALIELSAEKKMLLNSSADDSRPVTYDDVPF